MVSHSLLVSKCTRSNKVFFETWWHKHEIKEFKHDESFAYVLIMHVTTCTVRGNEFCTSENTPKRQYWTRGCCWTWGCSRTCYWPWTGRGGSYLNFAAILNLIWYAFTILNFKNAIKSEEFFNRSFFLLAKLLQTAETLSDSGQKLINVSWMHCHKWMKF